ncbi:hypothetical protein Tco_0587575 [Tanacetum coccineum]|uniref:Uncharacterized protein n=1 Tax=Tanacetum coccineum TaxID=301880 RepID=A0ABQ5DM41_9ASTR
MKSVALKTRLARKTSLKKKGVQKEYVSKQGRKSIKSSKGEPSVHKDPNFEDLDDFVVFVGYKEVSTEAPVSTVKPNEGTDKRNKGTDKQDGGTDSTKVSTDRQGEGTKRKKRPKGPLPKIDPKDKGKKMIDEEGESDTESDDITEAEKKFKMAYKILAEELQKEEREKFTIEQRAKFLHDTIAAQRKFLAQQ